MRIKDLQEATDHWIRDIGVRYFNEMTNTLLLVEEVGEFARLIARKYGEQSFKEPSEQGRVDELLESEIADIFFVLVCLSNQLDIDLEKAMTQTLLKKTERDSQRHKNNPKLNRIEK